ncbi:MAG TPA: hypothetical protein VHZ81_04385 [Galbitalea sp.]|jgi:hypothetical protein|nr:hypothetical protein [Galbitalea sp.]
MSEGPYTDAQNGYMPASDLVSVQGMQLQSTVAAAWLSEVAASGGLLTIYYSEGAYRPYAMQQSMYDADHALATPGHSTHGWGTCVDINTASGNDWAIDHFSSAVWVRDRYHAGDPQTAAYEWNHWHYIGALSTGGGDEMPFFNNKQSTAAIALSPGVEAPVVFAGTDYDLAGTPAGGPGTYDITIHIYYTGLTDGEQVQTRLAIEDVSTLAQSGWYKWTDQGVAGGVVEAEHTTKLVMAAGKRLRLYALTSASGVGISLWGRVVLNYQS